MDTQGLNSGLIVHSYVPAFVPNELFPSITRRWAAIVGKLRLVAYVHNKTVRNSPVHTPRPAASAQATISRYFGLVTSRRTPSFLRALSYITVTDCWLHTRINHTLSFAVADLPSCEIHQFSSVNPFRFSLHTHCQTIRQWLTTGPPSPVLPPKHNAKWVVTYLLFVMYYYVLLKCFSYY